MSDYQDINGNPCSLDALCVDEPAWAANRIRAGLDEIDRLTAEIERLRAALSNLVYVKDWKDKNGKDETYQALQPAAWSAARKALQKGPHEPQR